jgi:hypothetical protein
VKSETNIILAFIAGLIFFIGVAVGWMHIILKDWHEEWQVVNSQPVDTRPKILQCDKELWERITQGCDDEGHD